MGEPQRVPVASTSAEAVVDVVIPVHNEAACVAERLPGLASAFSGAFGAVTVYPVENGSTDGTWSVLAGLEGPTLRPARSEVADYGAALRHGFAQGDAEFVVLGEIDFCELAFATEAVERLLAGADLVQSSKACAGSVDDRPLIRRVITWGFNHTLRLLFGFPGTDTHGMKAARRDTLESLLAGCVLDGNLLATEMVLRAQRAGLTVVELPVEIHERRRTSIGIWKRVPSTLRDLWRLRTALRSTR